MTYKPSVVRERFFENETLPPEPRQLVWPSISQMVCGLSCAPPATETGHQGGGSRGTTRASSGTTFAEHPDPRLAATQTESGA